MLVEVVLAILRIRFDCIAAGCPIDGANFAMFIGKLEGFDQTKGLIV
jgi:hypothetical protein